MLDENGRFRPSGIPFSSHLAAWTADVWNTASPMHPNTLKCLAENDVTWDRCMAHIPHRLMPEGTPTEAFLDGCDWWACPEPTKHDTPYCEYHDDHAECSVCGRHRPRTAKLDGIPAAWQTEVCCDCAG